MGSSPFGPDGRRPFFLDRPFASRNLMSKAWEPCSFTKVPDYSQTYTSNILSVQEKLTLTGVSVWSQSLSLTKHMAEFSPVPHTSYIRDYGSAPLRRNAFSVCYFQ